MSDDVVGEPWAVNVATRHAVVMELVHDLARAGHYEEAVAACEELLDEDPDAVEALLVIADAAPRYGHGEVGLLAAKQAERRGENTLTLQAAALFGALRVGEALQLAEHITETNPSDARAWAVLGQSRELLGEWALAEQALTNASVCDPGRFSTAITLDAVGWDRVLLSALSRLSAEERDRLAPWTLDLCRGPALDLLRRAQPPVLPSVLTMRDTFEGGRLHLFQNNLARDCQNEERLVERVVFALTEEAYDILDVEAG